MAAYLNVNGIDFKKDTKINSRYYDLAPSVTIPGIELIKSAERSLDGTLRTDVTAKKQKLQIVFDVMEKENFECLLDIFDIEDTANSDGFKVKYFDLAGVKNIKNNEEHNFFVDNINFTPFIMGDEIKWRDVTIDLLEI